MLPTKFQSNGLSAQEEKRKIDSPDGGNLGFTIGTSLAIFELQAFPMGTTMF